MKAPKMMPVNSIAQMMKPAHLRAPSKTPAALEIIKSQTKPLNENEVPNLKCVNGVGHFVLPLQRIHFTYCSHCGDSDSAREFMSKHLMSFAKANPSVEVVVEARFNKRPTIYAHYLEGRHLNVTIANKSLVEIQEIVQDVRDRSGSRRRAFHQEVKSETPAVRPIWSPFHATPVGKLDPLHGARTSS